MGEEPKRVVVICKRDAVMRFWKITLEHGQDRPSDDLILKVLRFLHQNHKYEEFTLYSDTAYFEIWNKDEYREIDYTDILNVQGKNYPKSFNRVTLFPEANIQTTADIIKYNRWRKTTFRAYVKELQNGYNWEREDGQSIPKSYYSGWLKINPDRDIHTINPSELSDSLPERVKKVLFKIMFNTQK